MNSICHIEPYACQLPPQNIRYMATVMAINMPHSGGTIRRASNGLQLIHKKGIMGNVRSLAKAACLVRSVRNTDSTVGIIFAYRPRLMLGEATSFL